MMLDVTILTKKSPMDEVPDSNMGPFIQIKRCAIPL